MLRSFFFTKSESQFLSITYYLCDFTFLIASSFLSALHCSRQGSEFYFSWFVVWFSSPYLFSMVSIAIFSLPDYPWNNFCHLSSHVYIKVSSEISIFHFLDYFQKTWWFCVYYWYNFKKCRYLLGQVSFISLIKCIQLLVDFLLLYQYHLLVFKNIQMLFFIYYIYSLWEN